MIPTTLCKRWLAPTLLMASLACSFVEAADWKVADGPLKTRWAKDVSPTNALPEYPRPQLVREEWKNLNGLWQLGFGKVGDLAPVGKDLPEQILVPYPVESALSGVMKQADRLWYRRTFEVPATWRVADKRTLLHFGAVDWEATVWVNGKDLGSHKGGYDPFDFDITDALKPVGDQELIVRVFDPTDAGTQPRGKQTNRPGGIFYTPTTGIWQTVWIEPVAKVSIQRLKITPDVDAGKLVVQAETTSIGRDTTLAVTVMDGPSIAAVSLTSLGGPVTLVLPRAKPWTPDSPFLYDLKVELRDKTGTVLDTVQSYAGLRKIEVSPDEKGVVRIKLNGKPMFQVGPLDQGFWPDGLYTAPTDAALKYDVEITKQLGFNMTRKHVKVEPDRWYYWCDKLGLVVWQDMPSGDKFIGPNDPDAVRSPESAAQYNLELKEMIDALYNHPSIVLWVVFNEGWGQFDTRRVADWTRSYDPTRLVDAASGWADRAGVGDVHDNHTYPRPFGPDLDPKRAAVVGEFGGLSLGVDGHTWQKEIWGYQGTSSGDELTRKYEQLLREGWAQKETRGLNALVYTQITDVETEANGLLTYDRAIIKVDLERAKLANLGDFSRAAILKEVVPTSQQSGQHWQYSTDKPSANWFALDFDATSWKEGPGVLGTERTPGANVRTTWNTPDVWARREFTLPDVNPSKLLLTALHDEDAEFYLNGVLAVRTKGHVGGYVDLAISPEARATLKPGKNLIAVHCHQTLGGQSIDAGLVEVTEPSRR